MLGVLEPLLERTVFEDMPTNLAAIKQRVEAMQAERDISQLEAAGEAAAAAALRRKLERPSLSGKRFLHPVPSLYARAHAAMASAGSKSPHLSRCRHGRRLCCAGRGAAALLWRGWRAANPQRVACHEQVSTMADTGGGRH